MKITENTQVAATGGDPQADRLRPGSAQQAYADIADHGLIGDRRTAALVASEGTIDWWCLPAFDGDIVLGALLDAARGGLWRLGPRGGQHGAQEYVGKSGALRTRWSGKGWELELLDVMLLPANGKDANTAPAPTILRRLRCVKGRVECLHRLEPRLCFDSPMAVTRSGLPPEHKARRWLGVWCSDAAVAAACEQPGGHSFELGESQELWVLAADGLNLAGWNVDRASAALDDTLAAWERWANLHPYLGPQRDAVLDSLRAIRLLSYEPSGSQVAAPTTSLPEKIGGDSNYDYRYAWVRDSSLALAILSVFGDLGSAERYMDWLAARESASEMPLQVLYRIDGGCEAGERVLEGVEGYAGSRPVRIGNEAVGQLQLDSLGYLADCALVYLQHGGNWKPEYGDLVDRAAGFTAANWHRKDNGIWELRGEQRHYVSSKAMGWVVLNRACRIKERLKQPVPQAWLSVKDEIHADVMQRGWSEQLQAFRQHYDGEELDASVLLLATMDFLPADHPRMAATIAAVQRELQQGGFVWRFHPRSQGKPDLPLDGLEGAFLPCTFWMASALARLKHTGEARELLERVNQAFHGRGLYSEEFDPVAARALGNFPLLFSHAEHLKAVMDLAMATPLGMAEMAAGKAAGKLVRAIRS